MQNKESEQEDRDSLQCSSEQGLGLPSSSRRGGKGSRARRLQNFQKEQAKRAAKWLPLTTGVLRQERAKLRDGVHAAWLHLASAREKVRRASWRAWTSRSLNIQGPDNYLEHSDLPIPARGTALAPVSRRDMWLLGRAVTLGKHVPEIYRRAGGLGYDAHRHVLDWLRVEQQSERGVFPHWCHTLDALGGEDDDAGLEFDDGTGGSEYPSDEDDSCHNSSEFSSDEDDSRRAGP